MTEEELSSSQRARLEADILLATRLSADDGLDQTVIARDVFASSAPLKQPASARPPVQNPTPTPVVVTPSQPQQPRRPSWEMDEQWRRIIRSKVEDERRRLDDEERLSTSSNRDLYKLFNDLQGISHDFGLSFDTPEIVVVGMQSDGKSSFVEALLGFQFNIVDSNIGTRRPLIIQMINNPAKEVPSARFRKETVSSAEEDPFEPSDTPVEQLSREITRRTNELAGPRGDRVCDTPIILRVEYAGCANLNIYDTPGFRLGGDEKLRDDIRRMVRRLIEPRHRIIVCLEQSTVEWANTVSRPIVQEIDPTFSRTILINTKFDNRMKEFNTALMANKYLSGEEWAIGTAKKKPFFISLPVRRGLNPREFRDAIRETYLEDYSRLLELGFDEKRFHSQVGLCRARAFLEQVLAERHERSVAPTLRMLDGLCRKTEAELAQVRSDLSASNVQDLK